MAHVDEWCGDEEAEEFLRQRLRLPGSWLAEAQALWARYCQDDAGERLACLPAAPPGGWCGVAARARAGRCGRHRQSCQPKGPARCLRQAVSLGRPVTPAGQPGARSLWRSPPLPLDSAATGTPLCRPAGPAAGGTRLAGSAHPAVRRRGAALDARVCVAPAVHASSGPGWGQAPAVPAPRAVVHGTATATFAARRAHCPLLPPLRCPAPSPAGNVGRLSDVLQELEEHAAAVNAAGGAGTWESGGGAYAAFLWLRVRSALLRGRLGRGAVRPGWAGV